MSARSASASVVVIGAGQAGLSAAYHLQRLGFTSALGRGAPQSGTLEPGTLNSQIGESAATGEAASGEAAPGQSGEPRTLVVLDAADAPGGAWQHRWESLTMATVNSIFDLPGMPKPPIDPDEPSREAVPRYFAQYERRFELPILRPVRVRAVREGLDGRFEIETDDGPWSTRAVINATGTWDNPLLPQIPGGDAFLGRQLHTRDYASLQDFAGQRVAVVGAGISAIQHLEEISRVATPLWYTRREPVWLEDEFTQETGRAVIEAVTADVEAGRPARSVSSYTGLPRTSYARAAEKRGVLLRRPMFTRIEPRGVREADGSFTSVDTILWATGFRPALAHLDPLRLHNEQGGITMRRTAVADDPRVHLVGFGPTQSTVGANRAGRTAARAIERMLREATLAEAAPAVIPDAAAAATGAASPVPASARADVG